MLNLLLEDSLSTKVVAAEQMRHGGDLREEEGEWEGDCNIIADSKTVW